MSVARLSLYRSLIHTGHRQSYLPLDLISGENRSSAAEIQNHRLWHLLGVIGFRASPANCM